MFLHGIPFIHLASQYPILSSEGGRRRKSPAQRKDARGLVRRLGFEPVHLLRSSRGYPLIRCIEECLRYGDTVLAFPAIPYPRVQLSRREWGIPRLQVPDVAWILTTRVTASPWFRRRLPDVPLLLWTPAGKRGKGTGEYFLPKGNGDVSGSRPSVFSSSECYIS